MSCSVYIRPLVPEDALVSYQWRNNPRLWRIMGCRPDRFITPEMESAWLVKVLQRQNERRFAICHSIDNKYIGNVFLTDMQNGEAQIHIFIGEMEYWGKGTAYVAIRLLMDIGFRLLHLDMVYALVNSNNASVIALARLLGFRNACMYYDNEKEMMLKKIVFTRKMHDHTPPLNYRKMDREPDQPIGKTENEAC